MEWECPSLIAITQIQVSKDDDDNNDKDDEYKSSNKILVDAPPPPFLFGANNIYAVF